MNRAAILGSGKAKKRWDDILAMINTKHKNTNVLIIKNVPKSDINILLSFYAILVFHFFGEIELAQLIYNKYKKGMKKYASIISKYINARYIYPLFDRYDDVVSPTKKIDYTEIGFKNYGDQEIDFDPIVGSPS